MERPTNQMMPNGMQRPQSGNQMQQIHAMIMGDLKARVQFLPPGWQSTFDLGQRANRIMQLVTTLRLLQQDATKCLQIAQGFEERCIQESPTKEIYNQKIQSKLAEIQAKRAQQVSQLHPAHMGGMLMNNQPSFGIPQNDMNNFNMMQNPGMAAMGTVGGMNGMNGMNMNPNLNMNMNMNNFMAGGGNMMNGGIPNQTPQQGQGFPAQLQRPMQASPLPLQQQTNAVDPSSLQNPNPNGSAQPSTLIQANPQQQQNNAGINPQAQNQGPTQQEITDMARRLFQNTSEEKKVGLRNSLLSSYDPQKRDNLLALGGDPLVRFFMVQARDIIIKRRQAGMPPYNAPGGAPQTGNNNPAGAANMQSAGSQVQNFDLSSMLGQQANAIKAGEDGEQVVPASNNQNLALGGQPNMNQGLNPQMLSNQNGQAGNNLQLQQLLALEREKQRQRQQLQQNQSNQLTPNQAMAQQQAPPLRGIPGGLNTPNGPQVNTPAMPMLTQPVGLRGQAMPSTPQPNRPPNATGAPVSGANQVMQHHQTMLNQNSQQMGQGQMMNQREQIINSLPPNVRDRLSELDPSQINEILVKWKNQTAGGIPQQGAGLLPPNMNANGLAGNNRQGMMQNMPSTSAIPGFNSQPPPNQQAMLQQNAAMDPMTQQRLQQFQQQQQLKARALDMRPFPKQILSTLSISVPDTVTEWGKLKQHIMNNQAVLPPNTLPRLQQAQAAYFEAHPEEVNAAITALQQRLQQMAAMQRAQLQPGQPPPQAQQQQNVGPSQSMPNGQAPQAQMTQPGLNGAMLPQPQQPQVPNAGVPNMNIANMNSTQFRVPQPPSQNEINQFRQKIPTGANMTDDQIRSFIMEKRMQQVRQQAHQAQQQALQIQQQAARTQMQRPQVMGNGVQQINATPQPNQAQHHVGQRPQQQQMSQQPTANGQAAGQKRAPAANDDVMEIPNPNLATRGAAPPAPNMQANPNQQLQQGQIPLSQIRPPTQEELANMTPEQKHQAILRVRQIESLRKAQFNAQQAAQLPHGSNQQLPQAQQGNIGPTATGAGFQNSGISEADPQRVLQTWYREVMMANPKGPAVQLDAASREQLTAIFKRWWTPIQNIDKTFAAALKTLGEAKVKEAMRIRHIFTQNVADANGTVKDYLSIGLREWQPMNGFLLQYFTALKVMKGNSDVAKQYQQQQQQPLQQPQQGQQQIPQIPQAQLNSVPNNAQAPTQGAAKAPQAPSLDRKTSQQSVRKASASTKVPAAPTEKKRFDWEIRNGLTADKLKLPAQKKRKTDQDSPDSRASASAGSPPITQPMPDQITKPALAIPQKAPEPEKARFKCDDLLCDASIVGFDTEEKLKEHKATEHGPVEDAFEFLMENTANALGLDKDGNEKKSPVKAGTNKMHPASGRVDTPTTTGAKASTPVATPASGGKTAPKPTSHVTSKELAGGKTASEQENTLLQAMAEKVGFDMSPAKDNATKDNSHNAEDAFLGGLESAFLDSDLFINDWSDLATVTDWGFPPLELDSSPELTPSSRDSDVSQTEKLRINMSWDAFGNGDTGVPEILTLQQLGLEDGITGAKGEDTAMLDADDTTTIAVANGGGANAEQVKEKDATKPTTTDDEWNWHADLVDWDWGADASLEGDVNFSAAF